MTYSIIIAHKPDRDSAYLDRCLDSIQPSLEDEVIIASEGNKSESRNRAAQESHGDFLIFFDDDVAVRKNCIEELLEPFEDPQVGIVGGVNIQFENISFEEHVGSILLSSRVSMLRSSARYTPTGVTRLCDESEILSCVMAVRRSAFIESGGFPVDTIPCEENVLINRIQGNGWKVIYNPFAVVHHRRPKIFIDYWRTIFDYGKGRGKMMKHREGSPKMMWNPSWKWFIYGTALIGHYVSYVLGVTYGYLKSDRT